MNDDTMNKLPNRACFEPDDIPMASPSELAETCRQFERGYRQFLRRRGLSDRAGNFRAQINASGRLALRLKTTTKP